jgi:PAS domain S-box-containing protein
MPVGRLPARAPVSARTLSSKAAPRRLAAPPTSCDPEPWPEAHRHLAAIVEHSNDAILCRTLEGTITTWNAAAGRIFGFRAEEIMGRPSDALLPPGHRDEFRKLVARLRRGEVVQHFETEHLRKDGRRIRLSLTLSPIRDFTGRLIGFSTIARDITEQRRVREALERRERELDDLFEEASVGLLLTTRDGRILRANPALLGILERKADECVGHPLFRFHPDRAALSELLQRLAGRETLRNFQTALCARNSRVKEVLVDANAFWENGKVAHIRWFIRDITRRKQLEREILAITERERRAFSRELHDSLGQQLSGIA